MSTFMGFPAKKACAMCGTPTFALSTRNLCPVCSRSAPSAPTWEWEFGTIVSMDWLPDIRVMIVCPAKPDGGFDKSYNWWGMVLRDDDGSVEAPGWDVGEMITLSSENPGIRIVE